MTAEVMMGLLIPFAGTSLGAAMVFFFSKQISDNLQKILEVSSQTIQTGHIEIIPFAQEGHHLLELRAFRVRAGHAILVDVLVLDAEAVHFLALAIRVLIAGADPDIAYLHWLSQ